VSSVSHASGGTDDAKPGNTMRWSSTGRLEEQFVVVTARKSTLRIGTSDCWS